MGIFHVTTGHRPQCALTLNGNILEGEFVIWGQNPRYYTIRMMRTEY